MPPAAQHDLTTELAAAAPKRWWNRTTLVLGALLLAVGGFLGGVQAQLAWGTSGAGDPGRPGGFTGAFPTAMPSGFGGFGGEQTRSGADQAAATTGTVKLVDGSTLYLETADGTLVTVRTDDETEVRRSTASQLAKIKAGDRVSVAGGPITDGALTATSITATG
ncbi:hypothetical protein C1I95_17080 [Micromonospora craterilacus]|uniref:DUF5666 domain-containing protein n=2 Tax=Micromonospora craterilacus TaxID=1655439 RepID=A0A2W2EIS2_9ACTN|nr:hypothetical protein C1I95_17080 [Micromonospora craterilacus]